MWRPSLSSSGERGKGGCCHRSKPSRPQPGLGPAHQQEGKPQWYGHRPSSFAAAQFLRRWRRKTPLLTATSHPAASPTVPLPPWSAGQACAAAVPGARRHTQEGSPGAEVGTSRRAQTGHASPRTVPAGPRRHSPTARGRCCSAPLSAPHPPLPWQRAHLAAAAKPSLL